MKSMEQTKIRTVLKLLQEYFPKEQILEVILVHFNEFYIRASECQSTNELQTEFVHWCYTQDKLDYLLDILKKKKPSIIDIHNKTYKSMNKYVAIQKLIANDNIGKAIEELSKITENSELYNSIIMLSGRYQSLQSQINNNLITNTASNIEKAQISKSLLSILEKAKELGLVVIVLEQPKEMDNKNGGDKKIKILFLASNPSNTSPLRLDKEMREIETELVRAKYRDKFELIKLTAVRIKDMQNGLLENSPNFVHFSGHGSKDGIALVDNNDKLKVVKSNALSGLFKLFSNSINCVFLNSCYSEMQANSIKQNIDHVIGMQDSIPDNLAIEFASAFYKAIGAGNDIPFSFDFAVNALDLEDISGSHLPIYLTKSN